MKEIVIPAANWPEALATAVREANIDTVVVVRGYAMEALAKVIAKRIGKTVQVRVVT